MLDTVLYIGLTIITVALYLSAARRKVRIMRLGNTKYQATKDPHVYAIFIAILVTIGSLALANSQTLHQVGEFCILGLISLEILYILFCWFKPLSSSGRK